MLLDKPRGAGQLDFSRAVVDNDVTQLIPLTDAVPAVHGMAHW